MLTAKQFWAPAMREKLREAKARGYGKPSRFEPSTGAEPGDPVKEGPHKGFRFHERWPEGLRVMESHRKGDADARRCLNHGGWYTDSFQGGAIYACAVEVRIPRRRAKFENVEHADSCYDGFTRVRWMEATAHTEWDQILISRRSSDLHDTLKECIRSADRVAELAAEEARDEDQKFQAEQQIEEKLEEVKRSKGLIRECISEIKFMRKHCQGLSTAYEVLRERICSELAEIRKARKRIALLEREPWQAVSW